MSDSEDSKRSGSNESNNSEKKDTKFSEKKVFIKQDRRESFHLPTMLNLKGVTEIGENFQDDAEDKVSIKEEEDADFENQQEDLNIIQEEDIQLPVDIITKKNLENLEKEKVNTENNEELTRTNTTITTNTTNTYNNQITNTNIPTPPSPPAPSTIPTPPPIPTNIPTPPSLATNIPTVPILTVPTIPLEVEKNEENEPKLSMEEELSKAMKGLKKVGKVKVEEKKPVLGHMDYLKQQIQLRFKNLNKNREEENEEEEEEDD